MEEIVPETNAGQYDPAYCCEICNVTSLASGAFLHLTGHKHRIAYFSKVMGAKRLDKKEALRRAKLDEEERGRNVEVIGRVASDEKYPWPEGHEPWLQKECKFQI